MADIPAGARFQLMAGPPGRPPVRELTKASGITCAWRLEPSHELSFTIPARPSLDHPGDVPEAAALQELRTDVHLLLDGQPIYTGRMGQPTDNPSDVAHTRTVQTAEYRAMLARRFWRNPQVTWGGDQTVALTQLIQAAQADPGGDLGISVAGITPTGQPVSRTTETGASILEELKALAAAGADGSPETPGFDWDITPGWIGRTLQLWYPGRGKQANPLVYRWQANPLARETSVLTNLTRTTNPGDYANAVLVTGGTKSVTTTTTAVDPGTGQTVVRTTTTQVPTTPAYRAVADIASRPEGLWQQTLSYPDIVEQAELEAKADERLAALSSITPTWSFDLSLAAWLDLGGQDAYWLGDTVPVIVSSGVVNDDVQLRVTEARLVLDGNGGGGVTFTLGPLRTTAPGYIASLGQRLAALELRS